MTYISRKEARAKGLSFYFTGKPCPKGHVSERRVHNGQCRQCNAEYKRAIGKTEHEREMSKARRIKNRDLINERAKAAYWSNPQKYRESSKKAAEKAVANDPLFYRKAYQRRIEYVRAYYQINKGDFKERARAARSKKPCHYNFKVAARRALRHKATPPWSDLAKIKEIYEFRVEVQNHFGEPYDVDHIIPLQGEGVCGLHVPWNLRVVPMGINRSKHNQYSQDAALAYEHRN